MTAMGHPPGGEQEPDIPFTQEDLGVLLRTLASLYNTEERAVTFLRSVRYPRELVPTWRSGSTAIDFWGLIFEDLDRGVMAAPYRRLLRVALEAYQTNQNLTEMNRRYSAPPAPAAQLPPADEPPAARQGEGPRPSGAPETCRLVAWLGAEERTELETWLTRQGLDPRPAWLTPTSASFRVNSTDAGELARLLSARPDLNWTIVAPGDPDYVIRYLSVQGPDGRSFRFSDVPSATPVGSVAGELVDQYTEGMPGSDQPTVVEHVGSDGPRRMNPDNTLAKEGVTEGSRLRVGFERRAAAVNPLDRREALLRVRNQMDEYQDSRPGFRYAPNSPALPTEYDIEFTQPSFGPPAVTGEEPPDISVHQLSVVLSPDFPIVAPRVRWLTDIFHPNVYPTYESERLRENPYMRGIVCLGTLAESYVPSLDFGELCATLTDIAGFRNYSVWAWAGNRVDNLTGQPLLQGDFYDKDAAHWTISPRGQERIIEIGGARVLRGLYARPASYRFEIEDVSELDE